MQLLPITRRPEETGLPAANVLIYKLEDGETVSCSSIQEQSRRLRSITQHLVKIWQKHQAKKDKLAEGLKADHGVAVKS